MKAEPIIEFVGYHGKKANVDAELYSLVEVTSNVGGTEVTFKLYINGAAKHELLTACEHGTLELIAKVIAGRLNDSASRDAKH